MPIQTELPKNPIMPATLQPPLAAPSDDRLQAIWRGVPSFGAPNERRDPLEYLAFVCTEYEDCFLLDGCRDDPELVFGDIREIDWRILRRLGLNPSSQQAAVAERLELKLDTIYKKSYDLNLGARFERSGGLPIYDASDTSLSVSQRHAVVIRPGGWEVEPTELPWFFPRLQVEPQLVLGGNDEDPPGRFDTSFVGGSPCHETAAAIASVCVWPFSPHTEPGVFVFNEPRDNPAVPTVAQRIKAVLDPDCPGEPAQDAWRNRDMTGDNWTLERDLNRLGVLYIDAKDWSRERLNCELNLLMLPLLGAHRHATAPLVLIDVSYGVARPPIAGVPIHSVAMRQQKRESESLRDWTHYHRTPLLTRLFDLVAICLQSQPVAPADAPYVPLSPRGSATSIVGCPCGVYDAVVSQALLADKPIGSLRGLASQ